MSAIVVDVVRTLDQLPQIYALRGIVYMGEQDCPFEEEFDGNDLSGATHLVARVGREPVGAIRIRWFAEFAKLERAAVVRRYRESGVAHALWEASAAVAARKGYRQILGHIEPRLLGFWERCAGFNCVRGAPRFGFRSGNMLRWSRSCRRARMRSRSMRRRWCCSGPRALGMRLVCWMTQPCGSL